MVVSNKKYKNIFIPFRRVPQKGCWKAYLAYNVCNHVTSYQETAKPAEVNY